MPKNIDHKKIRKAAREFHQFLIREGEVKPRLVASPAAAPTVWKTGAFLMKKEKGKLTLVAEKLAHTEPENPLV